MDAVLLNDRVALLRGDSRELDLGENVVDAVVCDPPYELGFMGKSWDAAGIAYEVELWRAVLRALKPGGHLLAFGGPRTYHRVACAIEDAGFQIRDSLDWIYGVGFPKSLNISKAIDKRLGADRPVVGKNPNHRAESGVQYEGIYSGGNTGAAEITAAGSPEAEQWDGWGTALKPAHEPIVLARKPPEGAIVDCVLAHGTGGINVDGCQIDGGARPARGMGDGGRDCGGVYGDASLQNKRAASGRTAQGRWPANVILSHLPDCQAAGREVVKGAGGAQAKERTGSRKRNLSAENEAGGFAMTDGGVQYTDGEVDVYACAPGCPVAALDAQAGNRPSGARAAGTPNGEIGYHGGGSQSPAPAYASSSGGPSRFFYCTKPSRKERDAGLEDFRERAGHERSERKAGSAGSKNPRAGATGKARNFHPTVKPLELMRWLCRLVTPPGGVVLDPFTGSGTTGMAAVLEGFHFIGIEQGEDYAALAKARIEHALREESKCTP